MRYWRQFAFGVVICAPAVLVTHTWAQTASESSPSAETEESAEEAPPEFTEDFLEDPEHIAAGKEVWDSTCQSCHGKAAYPGKAPKLRPSRYDADFVYDRVTHGFRKMPAWKDVLSQDERMSVVAYILSDNFSP